MEAVEVAVVVVMEVVAKTEMKMVAVSGTRMVMRTVTGTAREEDSVDVGAEAVGVAEDEAEVVAISVEATTMKRMASEVVEVADSDPAEMTTTITTMMETTIR